MQTLFPVPHARAVLSRLGALTDAELAALDAEVEEARVAYESLEAVRRVAYLSQADHLGLGVEPEPPPAPVVAPPRRKALPAPRPEKKEPPPADYYPDAPAASRRSAGTSRAARPDAKKPNGSPVDRNRAALARALLAGGPATPSDLSARSGVARNGPYSVAALTRDHAWFEVADGLVRLSTLGHQAVSGKGEDD